MTKLVIFTLASLLSLALIEADEPEPETRKCNCDERQWKHYYTKGCKPVYEDGCHCPARFNCPEAFAEDKRVCYHNGRTYQPGQPLPSTNPCEMCECQSYSEFLVRIECTRVECGNMLQPPKLEPGCFLAYTVEGCCSSGVNCEKSDNGSSLATCQFEGETYYAGQKMFSKLNPCMTCVCDEQWIGPSPFSCRFTNCMFGKVLSELKQGCVPIYHPVNCCPSTYLCGGYDGTAEIIRAPATGSEPDPLMQCVFNGDRYNIGDMLSIESSVCTDCTCITPPDLTCMYRRCPGPPNGDNKNCWPTYTPGKCCPYYKCSFDF